MDDSECLGAKSYDCAPVDSIAVHLEFPCSYGLRLLRRSEDNEVDDCGGGLSAA